MAVRREDIVALRRPTRALVLLASIVLAASACGGGDGSSSARPTIKLAANPWSGSQVDVAVAKILLQEQLRYPVDVVQIDEFSQWPKIAAGELHACLEVWPSGHMTDIGTYIETQKRVENGGPLGPIGKIGWYVPTYVVDAHPELRTWEGLRIPANVALFREPGTGGSGRFFGGDPTWVQYDQQIIDNLGLDFRVGFAGSEEALLAEVDAAYQAQQPILFYFWRPHAAHQRYALTEVALPVHSDACYAKAASGGIDCDYPTDVLMKIVWSGLADYAPAAYQLLTRLHYSTAEQIALLAMVQYDGKTPEAAARLWIDTHEDAWRSWVTPSQ